MLKNFFLLSLTIFCSFLISCGSDDNGTVSPEDKVEADDAAIETLLNQYCFNDKGRVIKIDDNNADKKPLKEYAVKDESGYWYVLNPNIKPNEGESPDGKNNVLIHYILSNFISSSNGNYSEPAILLSTIDREGIPKHNPTFYKKPENITQEDDYYISEGILNGLKKFKAPVEAKDKADPYNLQGVIIVPSRLAYSVYPNQFDFAKYSYNCLILNFELYEVSSEEETKN